ncbi:MAG: hypothetical protein JKY54_06615 [Flavobacteriales bacterium]|nr:hypothetical protein [Flavobacteriales bacterium]
MLKIFKTAIFFSGSITTVKIFSPLMLLFIYGSDMEFEYFFSSWRNIAIEFILLFGTGFLAAWLASVSLRNKRHGRLLLGVLFFAILYMMAYVGISLISPNGNYNKYDLLINLYQHFQTVFLYGILLAFTAAYFWKVKDQKVGENDFESIDQ